MIVLKEVNQEILEFLYNLNIHPDIRAVSHNKESFTYEEHCLWWQEKMLNDKEFEAALILNDSKPVGCIRRKNKEVSIAIMPEYQNKGLGTTAIEKFCKVGDKVEILIGNVRSIKVFERAGFKKKFLTLERGE